METSDILVKCLDMFSTEEMTESVLSDYFGWPQITENKSEEELHEIFYAIRNIYRSLIQCKGVDSDFLHKCYKSNRLDEMIHTKNKYWPTRDYKNFVEMNIKIGCTYTESKNNSDEKNEFVILDDDYCPNCKCKGYITNRNDDIGGPPDCYSCCVILCKLCSHFYEDDFYCSKCLPCKRIKK